MIYFDINTYRKRWKSEIFRKRKLEAQGSLIKLRSAIHHDDNKNLHENNRWKQQTHTTTNIPYILGEYKFPLNELLADIKASIYLIYC